MDNPVPLQHIYIYVYGNSIKMHRGRGQNIPIPVLKSCRYLVEPGPQQLGLPVSAHPIPMSPKFEQILSERQKSINKMFTGLSRIVWRLCSCVFLLHRE